MSDIMRIGFLPLVDAALPILARKLGMGEEEGLALDLVRDMSWATVRDRLVYGRTDAAHLLAPLAIATTLGLERPAATLSVPFVLGLNGNAVTLSNNLADEVAPHTGSLGDPVDTGRRLAAVARTRAAAGAKLRIGVVHRYSSHNYILQYWLRGSGASLDDIDIVTIAPPFAADALAAGEIDGICVGEPWNSVAVDRSVRRHGSMPRWSRPATSPAVTPTCPRPGRLPPRRLSRRLGRNRRPPPWRAQQA